MQESEYKVTNPETGVSEIFIYGLIGGWSLEDVTASAFVKEFKALELTGNRINVRINSPGGSLWEGLAIFNAIAQSTADVHTYIDGIAYSMAGIIALAGKTVHMAKTGLLMVHNASGIVAGNANTMRVMAADLDKYDQVIAQTIADKTGQELTEILSTLFDYQDHLFTAPEALELKLTDIIEGATPEAEQLPEGISNMKYSEVLNYFDKQYKKPEKGFFNKLLHAITNKGTNQAPAAATGEAKLYSQADLERAVNAAAQKLDGELFAAKNDAEFWKKKAEEYGSQPGAMPSSPRAQGHELSEESTETEVEESQLFGAATMAARFQPQNN